MWIRTHILWTINWTYFGNWEEFWEEFFFWEENWHFLLVTYDLPVHAHWLAFSFHGFSPYLSVISRVHCNNVKNMLWYCLTKLKNIAAAHSLVISTINWYSLYNNMQFSQVQSIRSIVLSGLLLLGLNRLCENSIIGLDYGWLFFWSNSLVETLSSNSSSNTPSHGPWWNSHYEQSAIQVSQ